MKARRWSGLRWQRWYRDTPSEVMHRWLADPELQSWLAACEGFPIGRNPWRCQCGCDWQVPFASLTEVRELLPGSAHSPLFCKSHRGPVTLHDCGVPECVKNGTYTCSLCDDCGPPAEADGSRCPACGLGREDRPSEFLDGVNDFRLRNVWQEPGGDIN